MNRTLRVLAVAVIVALTATLVPSTSSAAAGPKKVIRVATGIGMQPLALDDLDYHIRGRVHARRPVCRQDRRVVLRARIGDRSIFMSRDLSARRGQYDLRAIEPRYDQEINPDEMAWLETHVRRKVVRKKHRRIVCRHAVLRWVPTSVGIDGADGSPQEMVFAGDLYSAAPECLVQRKVRLRNATTGQPVGTAAVTVDGSGYGEWAITVSGASYSEGDRLRLSAPGTTTRRQGKKIRCAASVAHFPREGVPV